MAKRIGQCLREKQDGLVSPVDVTDGADGQLHFCRVDGTHPGHERLNPLVEPRRTGRRLLQLQYIASKRVDRAVQAVDGAAQTLLELVVVFSE